MTRRTLFSLSMAAMIGLAACSSYGANYGSSYESSSSRPPIKVMDGVLTSSTGMTLYTFDKDPAGGGKSECNGPCAVNWPPLSAATDARPNGDYTIITRADGAKQWAYKGKPLYLWVKDSKPGDRTGDGFNNVWRVAHT